MTNQREDLNKRRLTTDRFVEIECKLSTGEFIIKHNFHHTQNLIGTLENAILELKKEKK